MLLLQRQPYLLELASVLPNRRLCAGVEFGLRLEGNSYDERVKPSRPIATADHYSV